MANVLSNVKRWTINGVVITIPVIVTLILLIVVVEFLLNVLSPVVSGVDYFWANEPPIAVVQLLTVLTLFGFFVFVGLVAEHTPGKYISRRFHATMEAIPGVGAVYTSVRQASNVLVDDDVDQFQEVKLVEFPHRDAYMLGFLTADTPSTFEGMTGAEMQTIMIPLGPNPTTNGFIVHVPAENVHSVDVTVEEAVRTIATLGVSFGRLDEED